MTETPDISLIVITSGGYDVCRRAMGMLVRQTVRDRIELLLVGPSAERIDADMDDLAAFGHHRIVEVGEIHSTGAAMATATRLAKAPVIGYVEEHDFVEPHHVETLLAEMERFGAAGIGAAMTPANPGLVSWAHLYLQFPEAVEPVVGGPRRTIGSHHGAYRRDLLMAYGDKMHRVFDNESILYEDMHRAGLLLCITGKTVAGHVQISRLSELMRLEFMTQRIYAQGRADVQRWSIAKRALYVAGAPAIPAVRLWRAVRSVRRTGRVRELMPQILGPMLLAAGAGAAGEAVGYVFGARRADHVGKTAVELDRYAFTTESDRAAQRAMR